MRSVLLIRSVRGLRAVERVLAERMRADGHRVTLPDLFDGATSESVEGGFAIQERVGWETMMARARAAAEPLPAETALAGVSAGAQVAGTLWLERPAAEGCSCCMGRARSGRRVEAHLAEPEPYDDEDYLQWWAEGMRSAGLDFTLLPLPRRRALLHRPEPARP